MCLLPVVNLACTFRYDPNKYVQPESAASVCACVFFSHITLWVPRGVFFCFFLQACLPLGQIAATSLCHVLVLYWSTAHVSHVNSTTPCRQLPPTSANASLTQLYVGGGGGETSGNLIVYNIKLILALLKGGWGGGVCWWAERGLDGERWFSVVVF